jgi:hypothetical protein
MPATSHAGQAYFRVGRRSITDSSSARSRSDRRSSALTSPTIPGRWIARASSAVSRTAAWSGVPKWKISASPWLSSTRTTASRGFSGCSSMPSTMASSWMYQRTVA